MFRFVDFMIGNNCLGIISIKVCIDVVANVEKFLKYSGRYRKQVSLLSLNVYYDCVHNVLCIGFLLHGDILCKQNTIDVPKINNHRKNFY